MKRKRIRNIFAVIVLALLLPLAVGVSAEELRGLLSSSSSSSSSSSIIVFYNVKDAQTALYVQKQVENASDLYPAPEDDAFEFTLKLNGAVERDHAYLLYDRDGRRIYVYEDGETTEKDETKFEIRLATDDYGHFVLKAGQTAKFSGIIPGDNYEITESETDHYQLTYPLSEDRSFTGTLPMEGAKVTFKNLYTKGNPGTLEVRKRISYPESYEVPETPAFTFEVKVEGKALANTEYTVKDIDSRQTLSTGTTDANGYLTLTGNTYALFENIPEDVDYSVREILDDSITAAGWRPIGETSQEGATKPSGTVAEFSNVLASFAVSKEIYGGSSASDQSFTFQVTDKTGWRPFGSALSYYLYDSVRQLSDTEIHQTLADGTFTLYAGQTAIFIGLEPGTTYGVKETDSGSYIQFLPTQGAGYTNKEVKDSVEVLRFVNTPTYPDTKMLIVKKTVENSTDSETVPDEEFTFRISRKEGDEYVPVSSGAYNVRDAAGEARYETSAEGIFTLHAGESAEFIDLPQEAFYRVEELTDRMPAGFTVIGDSAVEGGLSDGNLVIEIRNEYGEMDADLPESGGKGVAGFYIFGGLLILAAAAFAVIELRNRRKRTDGDGAE